MVTGSTARVRPTYHLEGVLPHVPSRACGVSTLDYREPIYFFYYCPCHGDSLSDVSDLLVMRARTFMSFLSIYASHSFRTEVAACLCWCLATASLSALAVIRVWTLDRQGRPSILSPVDPKRVRPFISRQQVISAMHIQIWGWTMSSSSR